MLAKTTIDRQRYWLKHVETADLCDSTIAEYAATHDVSLKGLYQWKTEREILSSLVFENSEQGVTGENGS